MRLNKYIAQSGLASRRKADELIEQGRVSVNNKIVRTLGVQVTAADRVEVDGQVVTPVPQQDYTTIVMYKPRGVTTTLSDRHARKTVRDLLPRDFPTVNPVGRLDKDSEGLLILTNDGDLAHELMHPSFEHEKEYRVQTEASVTDDDLKRLSAGIRLEEGRTKRTTVKRINKNTFTIVLTQGWKRQIRRMVEAINNRVTLLQRTRIGKLRLSTLKIGPSEYTHITRSDIL